MLLRAIFMALSCLFIDGARGSTAVYSPFTVAGAAVPRGSTCSSQGHRRIVGGEETSIEQHPWQVSVQMLGFHVCGGSIISPYFILTAGHCASYPQKWMSVRVNSSIKYQRGTVYRVELVIRHENFSTNALSVSENDIALLKVAKPVKFGQGAQSIALFGDKEEAQAHACATIAGWGALTEGGRLPDVLYAVDVPIVAKNVCEQAYKFQGGIGPGHICAADPQGGRDSCQGDSGGPLIVARRQAGIASWGYGCARKGYPGVYTEIAHFHDWIHGKMLLFDAKNDQ